MGAGRKTQSFTALPTQDLATYYSTMRNLKKNHLGGVIFGCNKTTMEECLSKQLFGLPAAHFQYVKNISPGLPLFLFNYSDRKLHGIYEASSDGQMNINPYGWTTDGSERTQFPAQVQIRVRLQCQPLLEFQFKPIIADNYYYLRHFWFELDHAQTSKLISLLASVAVAPSMPLLKNSLNWRTKFEVITSHDNVDEPEFREQLISGTKDSSLNSDSKIPVGKYDPSEAPVNVKEAEKAEQELIFIKLKELAIQCNRIGEGQDMFFSGYAGDGHPVLNQMTLEDYENPREPLDSGEKRTESPHSSSELKSGENPCSLFAKKSGDYPQFLSEYQTIIAQLFQEVQELKAFRMEQSKKIGYLEHKLEQAEIEIQQLKVCINLESESTPSMIQIDEKVTESCNTVEVAESCNVLEVTESYNTLELDPNESMYLVGGYDGDSWLLALDAYYPSENVIKSLRPMSSVRSYASVAQLDGDLFVIGGGNGHVWYDTVESYCPAADEWKVRPSLREQKGSLAAATTNNKIFAMGGGNGVDCFSDVEMLDFGAGRWIHTQSMLEKRFALAAVELNGVLYATGGFDGNSYLESVDRFDPREHSWTKIGSMNSKRGCHSLVVLNEKLYALGGFDGDTMVPSVEIFDPRLESWMPGEPMNHARGYSSAAVIKDAIYIIGGVKDDDDIADTVECYKEGQGWQEMTSRAISRRCFMSAIAHST